MIGLFYKRLLHGYVAGPIKAAPQLRRYTRSWDLSPLSTQPALHSSAFEFAHLSETEMHRPSWLRSKPKLKSGSFTDSSKASSSAQTKSQLSNYELGDQSQVHDPLLSNVMKAHTCTSPRNQRSYRIEAFGTEHMMICAMRKKTLSKPLRIC